MSASATTLTGNPSVDDAHALRGHATRVGMACFLLSEGVFFATLVLTYIAYLGSTAGGGPTPAQALSMPVVLVSTACLLSSSGVIHHAMRQLRRGQVNSFRRWWFATLVLGAAFLVGTALEWWDLARSEGLTPATNLFGSTYYTLVGFHALHVSIGIVALATVLLTAARRPSAQGAGMATEMVSWYWHFVDSVWVVVFSVVYLIGR